MKETEKKLKAHLLVCTSCTYKLPDQTDSSPEEGVALRKALKNHCREKYGKGVVQVSSVTCLGECETGIATVLYPKGEWNLGVRATDEEKLKTLIANEVNL